MRLIGGFRILLDVLAQVESPAGAEQGFPKIAQLSQSRGNILDRKVFDSDNAPDLLPRDRRRDSRLRPRSNRIDRCERPAPRILVVVDEDAAWWPLRDAILRGHERRVSRRQLMRQRF